MKKSGGRIIHKHNETHLFKGWKIYRAQELCVQHYKGPKDGCWEGWNCTNLPGDSREISTKPPMKQRHAKTSSKQPQYVGI